ncbi:hypothetical protein CTheo_7705 [Ceratobasidium theobromae]|uniref:Uncharacterized protein n=1 Tax=Ceratobasidium theobromae TaxID=1582974 RepID=A0A5N5QBQ7_9AGAM|nr:hypothetical protein CTheo_7705 [Ceratobasidium theobromae]
MEEEERFDTVCDANTKLEPLQPPEPSGPTTTWYSVITSTSSVGREPFLAIAHVRETKPTSEVAAPSEDDAYRRILILEQNNKRAFMIDPNPCYLDKDSEPLNEESLREMSQAGELLLKAAGSDDLKGFEVIGNYEEPTWVNMISETLGKLAVGGAVNMI